MTVTATPAPKSTVQLEIEVPPERLDRAIRESVSHLARRQRIPGFRPGKAPRHILERVVGPAAVLDDAVDHLVQSAYREAILEQRILPLTNADVEIVEAEEGKPLRSRPSSRSARRWPWATTGASPSGPRSRPSTTPRSTRSSRSCATRTRPSPPSRTAAPGTATTPSIGFQGTLDGEPVRGRLERPPAADHRRRSG